VAPEWRPRALRRSPTTHAEIEDRGKRFKRVGSTDAESLIARPPILLNSDWFGASSRPAGGDEA